MAGIPSASEEASSEKQSICWNHALGQQQIGAARGPVGGAEGVISGTQLRPLWALGTCTGREGAPGLQQACQPPLSQRLELKCTLC